MMVLRQLTSWFLFFALLGIAPAAADEDHSPPKPGPKERCAVCGMYVAEYPNWVAAIKINDASWLYFDGPKGMFKYLQNLEKYHRNQEDIDEVWVTEYYSAKFVRARDVFFVLGSKVSGPMGAEFVPVAGAEAAAAFKADHGGSEILSFAEISSGHIPH